MTSYKTQDDPTIDMSDFWVGDPSVDPATEAAESLMLGVSCEQAPSTLLMSICEDTGALDLHGRTPEQLLAHVDELRQDPGRTRSSTLRAVELMCKGLLSEAAQL